MLLDIIKKEKSLLGIFLCLFLSTFLVIFTNTENNKEVVSESRTSSSWQVAPSQWLSSTSSGMMAIGSWTMFSVDVGKQASYVYGAVKDGSEVSFYGTYKALSKSEELAEKSRELGINAINNPKEYMELAQSLGLTESQVELVIFGDSNATVDGKFIDGYSQKDKAEIGLNIKDSDTSIKNASEVREVISHELAHQYDTVNTTTEDREEFANTISNNTSLWDSTNNWLYGDGNLNNTTISNYVDKNESQLLLNNNYFHSLNPNNLDYRAGLAGRPISIINNNVQFNFNYSPVSHDLVPIIQEKGYIDDLIKETKLIDKAGLPAIAQPVSEEMINKGTAKEGEYYITLGGYGSFFGGKLTNNVNDSSDLQYIESGNYAWQEIEYNDNLTEYERDKKLIEKHQSYNGEANYPLFGIPNSEYGDMGGISLPIRQPEIRQTYNSNSYAYTLCSSAGGNNCMPSFDWFKVPPGYAKLIPDSYFNKK